jgi:DNA mismatch endonuclease (patch repair protein)
MRSNRSKDSKPELDLRRRLHNEGIRYRLHNRDLPGSPDLVLPKWKVVIFVHGCFWHGHACKGQSPKTNSEFWEKKLFRNRERDQHVRLLLEEMGWRQLVVWECALARSNKSKIPQIISEILMWFHDPLASRILEIQAELDAKEEAQRADV